MATLLQSYFAYPSDAPKENNYTYKTYVYAQPKPGNDHYASDFESRLQFWLRLSSDQFPRLGAAGTIHTGVSRRHQHTKSTERSS